MKIKNGKFSFTLFLTLNEKELIFFHSIGKDLRRSNAETFRLLLEAVMQCEKCYSYILKPMKK